MAKRFYNIGALISFDIVEGITEEQLNEYLTKALNSIENVNGVGIANVMVHDAYVSRDIAEEQK